MATAIQVSVEETSVSFIGLESADPEVIRYFRDLPERERGARAEVALRVGVLALKSVSSAEQVHYVEKQFQEMHQRFERQLSSFLGEGGALTTLVDSYFGSEGRVRRALDETFGADGELASRLTEHFGPDGRIVKELFDPGVPTSPLGRLRGELLEELRTLRERIAAEERGEADRTKMVAKGGDFEDEVEPMLRALAKPFSDTVDRTSKKPGRLGSGRIVGDFVVDLEGSSGHKIVFEAKFRESRLTIPKMLEEAREARENRGAQYAVAIARNYGTFPGEAGWFHEYDGNTLIISLGPVESEPRPELLEIAYRWARQRVLGSGASERGQLDAGAIRSRVDAAGRHLEKVAQLRGNCTRIKQMADELSKDALDLQASLKSELEGIRSELMKGVTPAS